MSIGPRHPVGVAHPFLAETGLFRLRIEAAQALLDEGARLVDETGRWEVGGARRLLVVQATRATHMFESVVALCMIGRGVAASMVNRALLEEVLDIHWVAANPDRAPELADDHERLISLGERAAMEPFGKEGIEPLAAEEREELSELKRRFSNFKAPWTLASDNARIRLVKGRWGDEDAKQIDFLYRVVQPQNNALLHPSPMAYSLAMNPGRRGPNRAGPDQRWRDALNHAVLGYYLACRVISDEFGLPSDAAGAYHFAHSVTTFVDDEELRAATDGEPCPCSSGLAVEDCHRS